MEKNQTKPKIKQVDEVSFLKGKFIAICEFIESNRNLGPGVIEMLAREEVAKGNDLLAGISRIETEISKDGLALLIVILREDAFPPNFFGPGVALPDIKMCFIQEGYSQAAHDLIRAHEIYHLEHAEASIERKIKELTGLNLQTHEIETMVAVNLLKHPIASGMLELEYLLKVHKYDLFGIKNFRNRLGKIFGGTIWNKPILGG